MRTVVVDELLSQTGLDVVFPLVTMDEMFDVGVPTELPSGVSQLYHFVFSKEP